MNKISAKKTVFINGKETEIGGERNLLELIRKAGIDLPTFCYHSELSVYGACRLCIVDVEGRGIMASCSTPPEPGMKIKTHTKEIRDIRKINVELLLANHKRECPTCARSSTCALQKLSRRLGIETVRYKQRGEFLPVDETSPSLTRDPNKCVLCGDCVRVCREIQGIGALDFVHRGSKSRVAPAFDQSLEAAGCVGCGQCAVVCPTGAIVPNQEQDRVWEALYDRKKTVVAQIAPAVRVALGEYFGMEPGANVIGKLAAALKIMGFDKVYDTCFAADMTIFEEATELIDRIQKNEDLPLITSCCPGWVKYAEINYPDTLKNLSTCKSPQQMFGAVAKETLPKALGIDRKDLFVVSIMPCTAKKFEAKLPKFTKDGDPDVDCVLTTLEIGRMIHSMGVLFKDIEPEAFDMPMGFSTGAGALFGTTGGVMEAALRYAAEKISGQKLASVDFRDVRGMAKVREAVYNIGGKEIKVAVVHGLANAKLIADDVRAGKSPYNFIEVMACPGGCIAGAGQPITHRPSVREMRARGLYHTDKNTLLQKPQDNYQVEKSYEETLGGCPGSHEAHEMLHTYYKNRSHLFDAKTRLLPGAGENAVSVTVTVRADGKNCEGKELLSKIADYIKFMEWTGKVNLDAAFTARPLPPDNICVSVGDEVLDKGDFESVKKALDSLVAPAD